MRLNTVNCDGKSKKKKKKTQINIGTTIGTSGKFSVKRDLSVNLFMRSDASAAVTL